MKRYIDRILSQGTGRQLILLAILCIILFTLLFALACIIFGDLSWQETMALYLDPGCFGGQEGHHDLFRLIVALIGMFTLNALLVSVFSNILDNVSDSWTNGHARYRHRNHILIIGSHRHLFDMLQDMSSIGEKEIVILTDRDVDELRKEIRQLGLSASQFDKLTIYRGRRVNQDDLKDTYPHLASVIYVLGEDGEDNHDSLSVRCVNMLYELCPANDIYIPAYVMLTDDVTTEVMARSVRNAEQKGALSVDYINLHDYEAEQFMAYDNKAEFMPYITKEDDTHLDAVIFGANSMTRAVAHTLAHLAHYPNFHDAKHRSRITIVSEDIKKWADDFMASHRGLFRLSNWSYTDANGITEQHCPDLQYGDYLDIDWHFVCGTSTSVDIQSLFAKNGVKRIVVCGNTDSESIHTVLHLPLDLKDVKVAAYQMGCAEILHWADTTRLFHDISVFGPGADMQDVWFLNRAKYGKNVNFLYDKAYNNPLAIDAEEAWRKIPEAHKLSSIYCAMALSLRRRSSQTATEVEMCEMEHRRWMMSCLLMGYLPMTINESAAVRQDKVLFKQYKKNYIHADITPYSLLNEEEKGKDLLLIENVDKILDIYN